MYKHLFKESEKIKKLTFMCVICEGIRGKNCFIVQYDALSVLRGKL